MQTIPNRSRHEIAACIDSWIFSERNRRLLQRRLLDGVTLEKIAAEFELSPRHVNTLVKRGIETIRAHI